MVITIKEPMSTRRMVITIERPISTRMGSPLKKSPTRMMSHFTNGDHQKKGDIGVMATSHKEASGAFIPSTSIMFGFRMCTYTYRPTGLEVWSARLRNFSSNPIQPAHQIMDLGADYGLLGLPLIP